MVLCDNCKDIVEAAGIKVLIKGAEYATNIILYPNKIY